MSKTIKQIAEEIGVSKQAVSYRLKRLESIKENGSLATKENGVLVVSLSGEKLIKQAFNSNYRQNISAKEPPKNRQTKQDLLAVLQATITTLQTQLVVKDKQIAELTATVKMQAESINADRHNQLAETLIDGKNKSIEAKTLKQEFSPTSQPTKSVAPNKKDYRWKFSFFRKIK